MCEPGTRCTWGESATTRGRAKLPARTRQLTRSAVQEEGVAHAWVAYECTELSAHCSSAAWPRVMLATMPGTQAHADPSPAEIEAQITVVWNKLEPLIEQYNGVHEQYQKNKAQQDDLPRQARAAAAVSSTSARSGSGPWPPRPTWAGRCDYVNAIATSGSPKILAEQLSYLDQLSFDESSQLCGCADPEAAVRRAEEADRRPGGPAGRPGRRPGGAAQDDRVAAERPAGAADQGVREHRRHRVVPALALPGRRTHRPRATRPRAWACSQAGKPYVWAAAGPNSYDCSGLVMAAWQTQGVYMPHNSAGQRSVDALHQPEPTSSSATWSSTTPTLHHVAIYVGDSKVMQAPSAGDYVRMTDMDKAGPDPQLRQTGLSRVADKLTGGAEYSAATGESLS